ncbi:MAG: outer membrane protein transport protein [Acidobacteriota bacterium]
MFQILGSSVVDGGRRGDSDRRRYGSALRALSVGMVAAASLWQPSMAEAGGFDVSGQSAHAMGMGGAYVAVPATPSTLFYNVGAAAFLAKQAHAVGVLYPSTSDVNFTQPPEFGVDTGFTNSDSTVLPHAYTVHPLKAKLGKAKLNLGVAIYSPFHHEVDWSDPAAFPGRGDTVSTMLRTLDLQTSISARIGNFGFGAGLIVRAADFEHSKRLATTVSGESVDFATLAFDTGQDQGFGFTAGVLHQATPWLSWGLSYRSEIEVDFSPDARLTQIATGDDDLDMALALTQPFGEDLPGVFDITFPASWSAGLTVGSFERLVLSLAVKQTLWSDVGNLDLDVISLPVYDDTIELDFEDSFTYSAAAQYRTRQGSEYRLGYTFDEGAQPATAISPFLYDPDKIVVSAGFGRDWLDFALRWINYRDEDDVTLEQGNPGTLSGEEILFTVTLKKKPSLKLPSF